MARNAVRLPGSASIHSSPLLEFTSLECSNFRRSNAHADDEVYCRRAAVVCDKQPAVSSLALWNKKVPALGFALSYTEHLQPFFMSSGDVFQNALSQPTSKEATLISFETVAEGGFLERE